MLSFSGSAPSLALYIHPAMDVRPTIFVALGLSRAPRACRHRLLGGLYSFPISCCAHAHAILPVWAFLSRAVPMALPHISPHHCGRCSLTSVERHLVRTASVARFSRPGHPLNSYLLHLPPMRTRTQPYLIRGCVHVTRFSLDSLYNIGIFEMCNPREM